MSLAFNAKVLHVLTKVSTQVDQSNYASFAPATIVSRVQTVTQLKALMQSDDSNTAISAIWIVNALKIKKLLSLALDLICDSNKSVEVRKEASSALGIAGGQEIASRILLRLQVALLDDVALEGLYYALGFIADRRASPSLLTTLNQQQASTAVRAQCAESLAYVWEDRLPWPVENSLLDNLQDSDASIRLWCCFALSRSYRATTRQILESVAKHDFAEVELWGQVADEAAESAAHIAYRIDLATSGRSDRMPL